MIVQEDRTSVRAKMFKALGDSTRIRIFDFLCGRCSPVAVGEEGDVHPVQGPTFGEVCCHVTGQEKINSTVSFHLYELRDAGLITVEKRGRFMVCGVNRDAIGMLADYLGSAREFDGCKEECL